MSSDASPKSPSDVRFGRALRHARNTVGWTQTKLARAVGCSDSHLSNVENGMRSLSSVDVQKADQNLGVKGRLVRLHRELYEPADVDWLDQLADLQAEAELIRESHPTLIPGLLQTLGYAHAVIAAGGPYLSHAEVDAKVEARMARSRRILGPDIPQVHAVIDETALTRPIGGRDTMREQLGSLIEVAGSGRVVVQIQPFGSWPHHGLDGPFSIISSASAPEVVHVESVYGGQTTDLPVTVRKFANKFGRLQATASSPSESVAYLRTKLEELP